MMLILREHSSHEDSSDQYDYTQLLYQRTRKISHSKDEMKGDSCDTGNGRDVKNILWNNIGTFGGSQEMFCKVCG